MSALMPDSPAYATGMLSSISGIAHAVSGTAIECASTDLSMKNSAGVLIYRRVGDELLVLVVQSRGAKASEPWSIPKGEFKLGVEDARHAAVREVFEELGVRIDASELAPLDESIYANKKKRVYCYAWEAKTHLTLKLDEHEISSAKFVTLAQARVILHEAHRIFVDRLLLIIARE